MEVHTTYIPPSVSNGWIKIEMLNGSYAGLTEPSTIPRLLCGDFDTPQLERSSGEVMTWGQRINSNGVAMIRQHIRGDEGVCWDQGERLAPSDLYAVYRRLHGYARQAYSWYPHRKAPIGRRI